MSERPPRPTDPQVAHTEHLLRLLKEVSAQDPPARLRERIVAMSSTQMKPKRLFPIIVWERAKANRWLIAASVTTVALVIAVILHVNYRPAPPDAFLVKTITPSVPQIASGGSEASRVPRMRSNRPRPAGARSATVPNARLMLSLPYSNADVSTGTSTTVRVAMSQSQLVALGLTLPGGTANSRIIADVALGDDGLPKAISLPFPLQVVKEN